MTASSFLFPLISYPYVSRILFAEGVGKVAFAVSVISYFVMIAQLGIPTYGIRACSQVRDDKPALSRTVHEIFTINTVMSVISYACFGVLLICVPKFSADKTLYLIASLTILFNTVGMEWLFKALEEYSYLAVRSLICKLAALVLMFLMIRKPADYPVYAAVQVLAGSACGILNLTHLRKYIYLRPLGNYRYARHMKSILIFFAMSCAITVYTNLDSVMLGFMRSDAEVGYYATSVKVKNILAGIVSSLGVVLLPRVSYYVKNHMTEAFGDITEKALRFVFLTACPLICYFTVYAHECIFLLSGDTFASAVIPMQIILPTLLLIGLTNIMGIQILVPLGREHQVLISVAIGAAVDLFLNLLLIPVLGITGAAIGTLFAEICVLIVQCIFLRDTVNEPLRRISYGKIIVSCAFATLICRSIRLLALETAPTLIISAAVFFITYLAALLLQHEKMISQILSSFTKKLRSNLSGSRKER